MVLLQEVIFQKWELFAWINAPITIEWTKYLIGFIRRKVVSEHLKSHFLS